MSFDALVALRPAGNPVELLTAEKQAVPAWSAEEDVAPLNAVQERLHAISDTELEEYSNTIKNA
jgi:hypothetical protein